VQRDADDRSDTKVFRYVLLRTGGWRVNRVRSSARCQNKSPSVYSAREILKDYHAPFDFHEFNEKGDSIERITDAKKIKEIARSISPVHRASAQTPPTMIAHGDADKLVPIQQAELFMEKLKSLGVECKLVRKAGGDHGWDDIAVEVEESAQWFDKILKPDTK